MTDTYKRFSNILFTFCFHSMRFIDISFVIVLVPFCAARQRCAFSFTKTPFRCARHAPILHCSQSQSYIFTYLLTYYRLLQLRRHNCGHFHQILRYFSVGFRRINTLMDKFWYIFINFIYISLYLVLFLWFRFGHVFALYILKYKFRRRMKI